MTTLFIADLHLHPESPAVTEAFLSYLAGEARDSAALYILGDFFDAWIGDDILALAGADPSGAATLAERVSVALRQLSEGGTRIFLMHGNRDFLLGEAYAEACGATLLAGDAHVVEFAGKPTLLMHGDTLCTRDHAYLEFRAHARDPQWQAQILALPIEQRIELARSLRLQSGEAISTKAQEIMDVTEDEVVRVMDDHGVTQLIHGHTHRPAVHELTVGDQPAKRLVLGDWQPNKGWDIRIEDDGLPRLRALSL